MSHFVWFFKHFDKLICRPPGPLCPPPYPDAKFKNNLGPLSSTFYVGRPETLTEWKSESITYGPTDGRTDRLTWVGAKDTCVSKKALYESPHISCEKRLMTHES